MSETVRGSAPGEYGQLRLVSAAMTFQTPSVDLEALAAGDVIVQCWAEIITAFNATSTNVITLGDGTTPDKYLLAADVTEGTPGVYPVGGKGPFRAETAAAVLRATYAQTGTAATTGAARIWALVSSAAA